MLLEEEGSHPTSERELVLRAQRYEPEALEELFSRHFEAVYRLVHARVGEPTQAEDVTGQAFARALEQLPKLKNRGPGLRTWLLRVASRTMAELVARPVLFQPAEASSTEELRAALAQLTPDQQEVLTLLFMGGLSVDQAAAAMGRRAGAIRALRLRGLQALSRLLESRAAV
jgi:RNA polymerase sigma-70 factor (ECF subfamily)